MTSLKTSIKTITYLSDTGCLDIQGASLLGYSGILYYRGGSHGDVPLGLDCIKARADTIN